MQHAADVPAAGVQRGSGVANFKQGLRAGPGYSGGRFDLLFDLLQALAEFGQGLGKGRGARRLGFRTASQHLDHRFLPEAGQAVRGKRAHVEHHRLRPQPGANLRHRLFGGCGYESNRLHVHARLRIYREDSPFQDHSRMRFVLPVGGGCLASRSRPARAKRGHENLQHCSHWRRRNRTGSGARGGQGPGRRRAGSSS